MVEKLKHPVGQFIILLIVALIWRCDTFGDPNLAADEAFYHMVGLAMHHGALPYVDIWDRKPFGLFAVYWLITATSSAPIAYQLAATLAAAVFASNLAKPKDLLTGWIRLRLMYVGLIPLLIPAAFGLLAMTRERRRLVALWLGASFVSMLAVGNFYIHHAMPLTVPLCIAAAPFLSRRIIGPAALVISAALSFWSAPPFRFDDTARSIREMDELVRTVKAHDAGRDLVTFEGPAHLYALAGKRVVTPLIFSMHLSALIEKDVSHLSTLSEMQRILALKPGVIVIADPVRNGPANPETEALVLSYVRANCRFIGQRTIHERLAPLTFAIWGDCRA